MGELTTKQRRFIDAYLVSGNATQAAIEAGYSERSAYSQGSRLLKNAEVLEQVEGRLQANAMTVDEALSRLADMARGDLSDFMDISGMGFHVNLRDAKEAGKTHLIKKVKQKTTTFLAKSESDEDREFHEIEIELHDPQAAIDKILKVAGAYVNRTEHTGPGGGPITWQEFVTEASGDADPNAGSE